MDNDSLHQAATALRQHLELTIPDNITEDELLQLLAAKIVAVIAQGPEPFYQLMYKVDIPEKKLNAVLGGADAAMRIARLVYDRQLQKLHSRRNNKMDKTDDDPELEW